MRILRRAAEAQRQRVGSQGTEADGGFALIVSLLLIMVVSALSIAMAAFVLNQVRPIQEARKQASTLNAAQAGLQAALTKLRSATDASGGGSLAALECTGTNAADFRSGTSGTPTEVSGASYSGLVDDTAGAPGFDVSMAYYQADPTGKPLAWLQSNAMACPLSQVPLYAYLQSYGTADPVPGRAREQGNRSQTATYTFKTSNVNVAGGRVRSYGTQQCLDAGSNPQVGTTLTLQPCQALGTPQQTWQYRTDLSIFYGGNTTLNLCIQAPASGNLPSLRTCTGSGTGTTYPYATGQQVQEFGFNDNGHFAAALNDGTVTNGTGGNCLQPQGATSNVAAPSGAALIYTSCDATTTGPAAFDPDPQVGAGKAGGNTTGRPGAPTSQYVNYQQFGRCLDITGQNVNADHLIAYPCKQAPNSSTLTFNQVWAFTAVGSAGYGTMSVTLSGTRYCLKAPSSGNLIVTPQCATTPGDDQLWQPSGDTGVYESSYRLVSKLSVTANPAAPKCMAVSPLSQAITFGSSNILAETCDGSLGQKWNAPPNIPIEGLGNIRETTSTG
jgi:Tfp pilus assembly protein PilX